MQKRVNHGHKRLLQIALIISFLIIGIQFGLFIVAHHNHKTELFELKSELGLKFQKEFSNPDSQASEVLPLSDVDIDRRMRAFSYSVFSVALVSTLAIILGIFLIFLYITREYVSPSAIIQKSETYLKTHVTYHGTPKKERGSNVIHAAKLSGIGEFVSTIAHDLKNPLTMVMANIDILNLKRKKGVLNLDEALTHVDRIKFSAQRIKRLVNHMYRISRDDFDLSKEVSVKNIVEDSLIILESKIKNSETEVINNIKDDLCEIHADAGSLEQVIMNLISNAIDALEEHDERWVKVSAKNFDYCIKIYVKDSGNGISTEIMEQIFLPFYTSKEEGKGTGLGLSICQKIINAHNGIINVQNSEDAGAEFIITLPKTHSEEHQQSVA